MPLYLTKMSKKDRHLHFTTHTSTNCTLIHPDSYSTTIAATQNVHWIAVMFHYSIFAYFPDTQAFWFLCCTRSQPPSETCPPYRRVQLHGENAIPEGIRQLACFCTINEIRRVFLGHETLYIIVKF